MTQIGHWPTLQYLAGFGYSPTQPLASITWTDITPYVEGPLSIRRGQQYELAQTQTGQATLTVRNWDGRFDPNNTAGPYYPLKVWTPLQIKANGTAIFTGYVERWPQTWVNSGDRFGLEQLPIVDAFALLSQRTMWAAAYHEIAANYSPYYLYPLDDDAAPTGYAVGAVQQFADFMGGAPLIYQPGGAFGSETHVAAAQTLTPQPPGLPGPFVGLTQNGGDPNAPAALTVPAFTAGTAGFTVILAAEMAGVPSGCTVTLVEVGGAAVQYLNGQVSLVGQSTTAWLQLSYGMTLLVLQFEPYTVGASTQTVNLYALGGSVSLTTTVPSTSGSQAPAVFTYATSTTPTATVHAALVAACPSNPDPTRLYSLVYGGFTDSTGGRFQDILTWAGWPGGTIIDSFTSGQTTTVGDPVEMLAPASGDGTNALQLLQTVVDTDIGLMYVDMAGNVVFRARRSWAVNPNNPAGPAVGEQGLPYTQATLDFDPTHVTNSLRITQTVTQATTRALDSTSIGEYGTVSMQRTVNATDWETITDGAAYILWRYAQPVPYGTVTVDLAALPAASWSTALALELGSHIQFTRAPIGSPQITFPAVVTQLGWTLDASGKAQLQIGFESVAALGFLFTGQTVLTLHTSAAAGSSSVTVNAMADAAVNGLDQNIGGGQQYAAQMWLINDPAGYEVVSFTAVPATGTGYTTAVVQVAGQAFYTNAAGWQNGSATTHYSHAAGVQLVDAGAAGWNFMTATMIPPMSALLPAGAWSGVDTAGRIAGY